MGTGEWRNHVDPASLPKGVAEVLDELDGRGWVYRSRWGDSSVRVWPDEGRSKQIVIDISFPMNEHRREAILTQTVAVPAVATEGGEW